MKLRRVKTNDMSPSLTPGAVVITSKRHPKCGDVVLVQQGDYEELKRVVVIDGAELTVADDARPKQHSYIRDNDVLGIAIFAFPGAKTAPRARSADGRAVATGVAALLTVMVTAQLMSFDKFIVLLDDYRIMDGELLGAVLAAVTVGALPYLLHMALSPAARLTSAVCGWLTALGWVVLGIQSMVLHGGMLSTGHLGEIVATPPGVWAVLFGVGLVALVGVAQWRLGGVWPRKAGA